MLRLIMQIQIVYFVVFVFASLINSVVHAQLEVPAHLRWKTLHTPHFEVIHNAKQQDLGRLYAHKLEEAYFALQPYFKSFPEKTIVVINDKTDITNGYATRLPYPHIMAYPVLPGPEDSLSDIGDWAFELLVHEYAHILNFEPANGIMVPLRSVFGTVIAPNILLPNWWKEGLAVELETRTGTHGRLRSTYQDAMIRSFVNENRLSSFTIAQANEYAPSWPRGMRPYIFGSLFWSYLLEKDDVHIVSNLNERQGQRVPYFIEAPFKEAVGEDYESFYLQMLNNLEDITKKQISTLSQEPFTPMLVSNHDVVTMTAPAISPNGKHMAFIVETDSGSRSIKLIDRPEDGSSFYESRHIKTIDNLNEALEPLTSEPSLGGSIQRVSWFPQSDKVVYDKIDVTNRIERYSDLYLYDLSAKKLERLTRGLRGREPSVSPRGDRIVFIKLSGGKTALAELSGEDFREEKILFEAPLQERVSYPSYLNDEQIIFSRRDTQGNEGLVILEKSTNDLRAVLTEFPNSRFARLTNDGVLFASSKNGVPNLYLADEELTSARPLTHVMTAAFAGDIDPLKKEIYFSNLTANGNRIAAVLPENWNKSNSLPKVNSLLGSRYKDNSALIQDRQKKADEALAQSSVEDYAPGSYLLPRYWIPFIAGTSSDTGFILSAQTSGFDPLKKHSYTLAGTWDTAQDRGSIEMSYLNQTTSLPFAFLGFQRNSYLGTVSNEFRDLGASLFALPDVFTLSRYASLQAGWQYLERSQHGLESKRTGPTAMFSFANYSKAGNQISPEGGGSFYLGATHYLEINDYLSHSQFMGGGQIYLSKWLPSRHAVLLRTNILYTPEKILSIYGASTEPVVFIPDSPLPQYILRGYRRGQVYGRNLATLSTEYRFPIKNIYSGSGTDPLYLRRFAGALVVDGAAADGVFINDFDKNYVFAERTDMKKIYWSAGVEFKVDTTLGYVIPATFIVGYYSALSAPHGPEGSIATTLQISGF